MDKFACECGFEGKKADFIPEWNGTMDDGERAEFLICPNCGQIHRNVFIGEK